MLPGPGSSAVLGELSHGPVTEEQTSGGSRPAREQPDVANSGSLDTHLLSEVLRVGGSGLYGPSEGTDDSETGIDASESALVVDGLAGNPCPEEDPSNLNSKDRVDLTGVGAVAAVVALGNVR